jgi:hypothetical protein
LSGCIVVPPFFLLRMEALAFEGPADMVEVEGKEGCVNGLEAVRHPSYDTYERC